MKKKIILTVAAVAAVAASARAQNVIQTPAGQAFTIINNVSASAVTEVTYQWYRDNNPISGATKESYTVPAAQAYGDNVAFYRMATAQECAGIAEKKSNILTITFTGYIMPEGCTLVLGGFCWATANVDAPQTFAAQADMHTKFYQWNKLTAYSADDPLDPAWTSGDNSATWTVNPCPVNWRLPSQEEFQQLVNSGHTWVDAGTRGAAVGGTFFGYNHNTCYLPNNMYGCVFLPGCGYRDNSGALNRGSGYYWSSTQISSSNANVLLCGSSNSANSAYSVSKSYGFSIRCVK